MLGPTPDFATVVRATRALVIYRAFTKFGAAKGSHKQMTEEDWETIKTVLAIEEDWQ